MAKTKSGSPPAETPAAGEHSTREGQNTQRCQRCGERVNALGRATDGGLHPGKACGELRIGQSVFVNAHGRHEEDFSGEIVRIDDDNYLVFVEAPDGETYGCTMCFVYPKPEEAV